MTIAILDNENARIIIGRVPSYLTESGADGTDIASAIFQALGLSDDTEYMLGELDLVLADHSADTSRPDERGIELLTQDFKVDALEALADLMD